MYGMQAALEVMNDFGRVIACGQISQYDLPPEVCSQCAVITQFQQTPANI